MRIALITPEYPGCGPAFGIGRYVADLAASLRMAGHAVLVLAATDEGGVVVGADRPIQPLPHSLLARSLVARSWLMRELEAFHPDVVEAPNWGALAAWLPSRWPLVVRLSTSAADAGGARGDLLQSLRLHLERRAVERADVVVADSHAMDRRSASLYGRPADAVIPHAWHGPVVAVSGDRPPDVLYVGRWEPRKGVDVLLAAWLRVLEAVPEARLHLVGGGQPPGLGGSRVMVHGRLGDQELSDLRHRCRVQVVPSRFESFGLVVLEAWAAGLVPVVTDAGALPEVVGQGGIVVPSGNVDGLAKGMVSALQVGTACRDLGQIQLLGRYHPLAVLGANEQAFQRARCRHAWP